MALYCDIDYCPEPGDKLYDHNDDYSLLSGNRRKRCTSCSELINLGAVVLKFSRFKIAETEIEERIYGEGEEIPRALTYMCEGCADIYYSITELGYSFSGNDMREALKEYHQLKNEENK